MPRAAVGYSPVDLKCCAVCGDPDTHLPQDGARAAPAM